MEDPSPKYTFSKDESIELKEVKSPKSKRKEKEVAEGEKESENTGKTIEYNEDKYFGNIRLEKVCCVTFHRKTFRLNVHN